jgi:hypothetical protein
LPRPRKRKSNACTICKHPNRALIEQARVAGASLDSIAGKHGISRDALHRHCKNHLSDDLRSEYLAAVPLRELAEKAAAEGLSVLQYLSLIRGILIQQLQLASSINDRNGVANISRVLNDTLGKIGQLTGEMGALAANHINITQNNFLQDHPAFARVQQSLLRALAPYPEARLAVVTALRDLDAETSPQATARPAKPLLELEATHV